MLPSAGMPRMPNAESDVDSRTDVKIDHWHEMGDSVQFIVDINSNRKT